MRTQTVFGCLAFLVGCQHDPAPVTGELTIAPTDLDFGVVGLGGTGTLEVTIDNGSSAAVRLLSVTLTDGDPDVFSVDRQGVTTVEPGTSGAVAVLFGPEREIAYTGQIQVRTDAESLASVLVGLKGTGGPSDADDDGDGYSVADGDCDDGDGDVHPGADEGCDGIDTDCDGSVPSDEADDDGDGSLVCEGDCDDADGRRHPGAQEVCDGVDNDCDPSTREDTDGDGDGSTVCDGDCDDQEPASFPGNPEICDGVDNDCNQQVDEIDADGDGHSVCSATGDCDDDDPSAYPIAVSPTGSPTGDGTDANPVDSIATALSMLDTTCRLVALQAGTYNDVDVTWGGGTVTIAGQTGDPDDVVLQAAADSRLFLVTGGSLELRDLTLTGGHSVEDGGAVRASGAALQLSKVVARQNTSDVDGGAVAVQSGSLTLRRGCRFEENSAGANGGAVRLDATTLDDAGSTWTANTASAGQGGALSINGGSATVHDGEFRGNSAVEGGAVHVLNNGQYTFERNLVALNSATGDGGGLAFRDVADPAGVVRNNRVQDNTATATGAGVAFVGYNGALQLVNNTLTGNDAGGEGTIAVTVAGAGAGIVIGANVLQDNDGPSGIYTSPTSQAVVLYDTVYLQNSGTSFQGACGDGSGGPLDASNAVRNPQLVAVSDDQDPDDDDLTLQAGSPEIDSGPPQASFDDPDGSANDRGFTGGPGAVP